MSRVLELVAAFLMPTAAGFLLLGGLRVLRWATGRRWQRVAAPDLRAVQTLTADLRRLRAELEFTETRADLPAKHLRVEATRAAYLDALTEACDRLGVTPPRGGEGARQAEVYRVESALRERGLDVRQPVESLPG